MGERGSVEPKHISILIEGPPGTSPDVWASLHIDDILDISDIQATYLHTHLLLQSPVGASWTATTTSDWRGPLYKNHPNGEKRRGPAAQSSVNRPQKRGRRWRQMVQNPGTKLGRLVCTPCSSHRARAIQTTKIDFMGDHLPRMLCSLQGGTRQATIFFC